MKNNTYFAFGLNSLIDTINNNRKIIKIFITKERYGDLQNIITLSSTGNLGASGIQSVGSL